MGAEIAVAIGVRRAGSLIELPGAVSGAHEFSDWAKRQGHQTYLVTDENTPVTAAALYRLMKRVVEELQPERLLLYFAGHGIQPTVNTAYWLLSNWEENGNEAVNVNLSCHHAKRSGIGQIAVFADACRSAVPGGADVGGSSIFPKVVAAAGKLPQWDHFLATRLEEIAQEVPGGQATQAYGVFTRCLMTALAGEAPLAIEERPGKQPPRAVTSQKLADYLEAAVPLESGKLAGAVVQFPEVVSGWRPERNYYVGLSPAAAEALHPEASEQDASARATRAVVDAADRNDMAARVTARELDAVLGRETLEMRQGLTILGARPVRHVVRGGAPSFNLFQERDAWHVRGESKRPHSVLIELEGGRWLATCILPEFVGTIVVKDGLAASLTYAPDLGSRIPRFAFEHVAPTLNRWTALMHQGRYDNAQEFADVAEVLRQGKHANPTLGILAAYAYERTGDIAQIDDIANWFSRMHQPIPFDVAVLSTARINTTRVPWSIELKYPLPARFHEWWRRLWNKTEVAGSFPLLTQGWSFLDSSDQRVHPALPSLRSGLLPALWTTLRADAGRKLADLVEEGALP